MQVNNNFNSAEDLIQLALGSMNAYSVNMEYKDGSGASCVPGIVALNHTEALIKFLSWFSKIASQQDYSLKVNLCE